MLIIRNTSGTDLEIDELGTSLSINQEINLATEVEKIDEELRTILLDLLTQGSINVIDPDNDQVALGLTAGTLLLTELDGSSFGLPSEASASTAPPTPVEEVANIAAAASAGSTLGLQQELLANAGQPALTVLALGFTNTSSAQGVSLGDGNVVEVYANGDDFAAGTVLYREFMSLGEPIVFTGVENGAIITSTQGFYGFSGQLDGGTEAPMPLLSYGLSFTNTFLFAFRDSNGGDTNRGFIHVVNGPLASSLELTSGLGVVVNGQTGIELAPWQHFSLETNANSEFIINSTNPVMACIHAGMTNIDGVTGSNGFFDSRLVMPLTSDGITWPRSGFVSAPFDNTQVDFFVRDNAEGQINSNAGTGVSPGSPVDFDAAIGIGTGANDSDYEPNGATRLLATGLVSAYSGADSSGGEASPLMPTAAMSQVVAQPFFIDDIGDGGNSGIAIASPYEGTARVFSWDIATRSLILEYTVPITRNGVTITDKNDQKHPAAGLVANEVTANPTLVGDLNAGVIIADVPITVVAQNGTPTFRPTLRSQNGTTDLSIINDDDETLLLGWTPPTLRADITEGTDNILYKRVIDGGVETWVIA